jgi:copper homeostasis protein
MSESVLVEACVDSIESALAAARGGAHGIELCANLVEGGHHTLCGYARRVP